MGNKNIGKIVLKIDVELTYEAQTRCDALLQIEAAQLSSQTISFEKIDVEPSQTLRRIQSEEKIGERIWLNLEGLFSCTYQAQVDVDRTPVDIIQLQQHALAEVPDDIVRYLMASRYCHLENVDETILGKFAGLSGGQKVLAMADWITNNFVYDAYASNAATNSHDSLSAKAGVCRDYAHVLIAMSRASAIPARIVSAYALNVTPQDFHALVEVYLEGEWYLVDPTGMSKPEETVIIGVGRDAADISFLTTYGFVEMRSQHVIVERCEG